MTLGNMSVLIVIPTYNERESLPELVPRVLALADHGVLVVDDDSPDGTGEIADDLARSYPGRVEVLHRTGRRGLGLSYIDGLRRALQTDATRICQMDADLSHDPAYLPTLVAAAEESDLVIGSRYLHGVSVVNWPLQRLAVSTLANRYVRFVARIPVKDCTSGFRCWRREGLARIPLDRIRSEGYAFLVEMLFEACRRECRVTEVPIIFVERRQGKSKLSGSVFIESLVMPLRLRLRWMMHDWLGAISAV